MKEYKNVRQLRGNGLSIRKIVERTGIARNTVRKILRSEESQSKYHLSVEKPSTVESFRMRIEEKLKKGLRIKRIWRELKEESSFTGGYGAIKRFIRRLKRENPKAYIRFETLPGNQTQNDWSSFVVEFIDGKRTVQLSNFVLCFSRKMHGTWYNRGSLPNLIDSHQRAFKALGGITSVYVYDNQKSVVTYRFKKEIVLNGKFQKFADYHGFHVVLCTPHKPNSKGKIERPFQYIEEDFVKGKVFVDLEDLNKQYGHWLDEIANKRIHGTTGKVPDDLWQVEKPQLQALPERSYEYFELLPRKVATDCLVSVGGSRYSVPWKYSGREVLVRNYQSYFEVFCGMEKIAEHKKSQQSHQMIINRQHYEGLKQRRAPTRLSTMQSRFKMLAENIGEDYFSALIKHHKGFVGVVGPRFLRLFESYPSQLLQQILTTCLKHEIYEYAQVREYLSKMPVVMELSVSGQAYYSNVPARDLRIYNEMAGASSEKGASHAYC